MKIVIRGPCEYDTGIHPDVTKITFNGDVPREFFKEDRFPNLIKLDCSWCRLTELQVNCPSLRMLWCHDNELMKLKLNCPSLQMLCCHNNLLTKLELNFPSLKRLNCYFNRLTELEFNVPSLEELACEDNPLASLDGLEFCSELKRLRCSKDLEKSLSILKLHLPGVEVVFE